MDHVYSSSAGRAQQPAQVLDEFAGVGGQRG
jgi:hypothetical protein